MRYRTINRAHSMNNGIIFFSRRHKGYAAVATIDKEEKWVNLKWRKRRKGINVRPNIGEALLTLLCPIIYYLILFWGIHIAISESIKLGVRTCLLAYSLAITLMFILISTYKRKFQKELYKYHSAEHMVLNAYRDLKRIPTLEEIYLYSRFSKSCGTNRITQIVATLLIMFACTFIPNILYMILGMMVASIIAKKLVRSGYLNLLQIATTDTPEEKHLILAIEGLNYWLENEQE